MVQSKVSFPIDVIGQSSKQPFKGVFSVKTKVSFRDSLREDEVRRNILGTNPQGANQYVSDIATILAYLSVRIQESPAWWKDSNNGVDLEDDNVLMAINDGAVDAIDKEFKKLSDKGNEAKEELKKESK